VTTAETFSLARQYHQAGYLLQAAEIYRQILHADPANAPALFCLGAACDALQNLPEAADCYRRLARLEPGRADAHYRLGVTFHKQGKLAEAGAAYRQAVQLRPDHAEAHTNLGVVLHAQGQSEQAIGCFRRALSLHPDYADVHHNLGAVLQQQGDLREAAACYQRAIQLRPEYAEAYRNLGDALREQGDMDGAVAAYRQALCLRPDDADVHNHLGMALQRQGNVQEAVACYRRALQLRPDYPQACGSLGNALEDVGDVEGAAAAYREVLRLSPSCAEAHNNLAGVLEEQGRAEEAVRHALEALRLRPDWALPLFILAELAAQGYYSFPAAQLQRIAALVGDPSISPTDASLLHFALALLRDKQGAYDDAFAHYRQANTLKGRLFHEAGQAFDFRKHADVIDQLIATFTPALFERLQGFGLHTELPVFIVGMPRSGTTLVEQILSSHPLVFGAGELTEVGRLVDELAARLNATEGYPRCTDRLDPATARAMAEEFRARLARRGGSAVRVTDKHCLNYLHLGLLSVLFPRARVIHCRRDPRDVCLSCYFQNFRGLNFTWELRGLGRYYRAYERLMDHWHAVLPVPPLEVVYEELVANQEAVSRQVVAFCGLDWDDRCLRFHDNRRPVQTMSKLQVRRPIFSTSVGRWRRYEKHLGPLLDTLRQGDPLPGLPAC